MRVLAGLTEVFLSAFQITRPRPEAQKQAERIIGSLMLLTLFAVLALIVGMLLWAFHA